MLLWLLVDDVHKAGLEFFYVALESVLLPSIVEHIRVKVMPLHAPRKEADAHFVVRFLLESQFPAVFYEFFELRGVAAAEVFQ